jgi:hypothetical protein
MGRRHQARDARQGRCLANGRTQEMNRVAFPPSTPPWTKSQIQRAAIKCSSKCSCSEESRKALMVFVEGGWRERLLGFFELWERWGQGYQRQRPPSRRPKRKFTLGIRLQHGVLDQNVILHSSRDRGGSVGTIDQERQMIMRKAIGSAWRCTPSRLSPSH